MGGRFTGSVVAGLGKLAAGACASCTRGAAVGSEGVVPGSGGLGLGSGATKPGLSALGGSQVATLERPSA